MTTKDEHGYSSKPGGGLYEDAFSTIKHSFPIQHQDVCKAPEVGNFIFEETTSKWKTQVIGAVIVTRGEKGGRKGAKRIMKVDTVVSARRRNKAVLERKFSYLE